MQRATGRRTVSVWACWACADWDAGFVFVSVPPPKGEKYAFSVPVTGIYSILVYPVRRLLCTGETAHRRRSPVCPTGTAQPLSSRFYPTRAHADRDTPQSYRRRLPPHALLPRRRVSAARLAQPQPRKRHTHPPRPVGIPAFPIPAHPPCRPCPLQTRTLAPGRRTVARQPVQSRSRSP